MRNSVLFISSTLFFIIIIFLLDNFLLGVRDYSHIEDHHIEPSIITLPGEEDTDHKEDVLKEKLQGKRQDFIGESELNTAPEIHFYYFPQEFERNAQTLQTMLLDVISYPSFLEKIDFLGIELHEQTREVRGRMKERKIKFFGAEHIEKGEFVSVFIHELGHYFDIYYLEKKVWRDPSFYFYDISWESTKVIKKGQKAEDFVSGYAMTNKYEDFAESFAYYILHNDAFLKKTKESVVLEQKYNFIRQYFLKNNEFVQTGFSSENAVKDYYWDITKIDIDEEKFLQYLKKEI